MAREVAPRAVAHAPPEALDIAVVSARTGLAVSALRFYEERGLIPAGARDRAGRRRFDGSVLHRVALIIVCRRAGFTLGEVKALLDARADDPDGWRPLVTAKVEQLQARIDDATTARDLLVHAAAWTEADILECPRMRATLEAALPVDRPGTSSRCAAPPDRG
jgi:DNA-binding transcriptional MerR regulator